MRVALVYRHFNLVGSLPRENVLLARSLAASGLEVHCYCDPATSSAELEGIQVHDIRPLWRGTSRFAVPVERSTFAARATAALRRDRARYDLVHVCGPDAWEQDIVSVPEVVAAAQRRWPVEAGKEHRAARLRAAAAPLTRPQIAVARFVQRLQFRRGRFRRALAVSERVRDDLIAAYGVPRELIDIVPHPFDGEAFRSARPSGLRLTLGLASADSLLLFVGDDYERKGLADAVAALPELSESAHLVVVGKGKRAQFNEQARAVGVGARLHFVGSTEAPEGAYAEADVFVLPTRHDPWAITIVEAMASGVPVVTTPAAGAASVVRAAGAGLIVPERAPRALADALRALLADPGRRRALGEKGRRAAAAFSSEARTEAVLRAYERAVDAPSNEEMRRLVGEATG